MSAMTSTGLLHLEEEYMESGLNHQDVDRFNRTVLRLMMVVGAMVSVTISILLIINEPITIPLFLVVGATFNAYFKVSRDSKAKI